VVKLARETGRSPSEVVDRLISFELLAQEARRRGLSSHPETREATRKAMVQRYLELEFEDSHRPEDMPEAMLRDAYQQNISQFVRPKLRRVAHLLVVAPDGRFTKDQQRDAFALAQEIHREAVKVNDLDAFRGLRSVFDGRRGFEVIEEIISTSVYPGAALATNFIDAAMELDKRGEVSRPVETSFGSHVIYLIDFKEAIDHSFDEVRDHVAEKEYPFWVKRGYFDLLDTLRLATKVSGYVGQNRRAEEL
jgi:parvulin-like peptidyl-prolyl isomerase